MSVFYDPAVALLDHVNISNGYNTVGTFRFTTATCFLSKPIPTEGTWREETTDKNTFLRISAKPTANFKGQAVITYNRLNLGDYLHFRPEATLPAHAPETVHDLIPNFLFYFGIYLREDEVHDDPLSLVEGAGDVTIRMKEDALIFYGEITIPVIPGGANINILATKKELDGLNYPVDNPLTEVSALLYCYPLDLSEHRDSILPIEEGIISDTDATTLADIIKLVDIATNKDSWNSDPEALTWSLQGATVIHNGLNNISMPTNQKYKYVMALDLREGVTMPSGRFYLHYNDPFDPDAVDQ